MATQRLVPPTYREETNVDEPAIDEPHANDGLCPDCGEAAINVQGLLDCPDCGFQG